MEFGKIIKTVLALSLVFLVFILIGIMFVTKNNFFEFIYGKSPNFAMILLSIPILLIILVVLLIIRINLVSKLRLIDEKSTFNPNEKNKLEKTWDVKDERIVDKDIYEIQKSEKSEYAKSQEEDILNATVDLNETDKIGDTVSIEKSDSSIVYEEHEIVEKADEEINIKINEEQPKQEKIELMETVKPEYKKNVEESEKLAGDIIESVSSNENDEHDEQVTIHDNSEDIESKSEENIDTDKKQDLDHNENESKSEVENKNEETSFEQANTEESVISVEAFDTRAKVIIPEVLMVDNYKVEIGICQNIGKRDEQQDTFGLSDINDEEFIKNKGILVLIADGMGGLSNGKEASEIVVKSIIEGFKTYNTESIEEHNQSIQNNHEMLKKLLIEANNKVYSELNKDKNTLCGSTLVAILIKDNLLYWISVGDSRIYLLREAEMLKLNQDHIYLRYLLGMYIKGEKTFEEVQKDADRNALTSFVGMEEITEIDINIKPLQLQSGDKILICSDGVYGYIEEYELERILSEFVPKQAAAEIENAIIKKNNEFQDNLTAIVIGIQ